MATYTTDNNKISITQRVDATPTIKNSDFRTALPCSIEIGAMYRFVRLNKINKRLASLVIDLTIETKDEKNSLNIDEIEKYANARYELKISAQDCLLYEVEQNKKLKKWQPKESKIKRLFCDGFRRIIPF